MATPIMTSATPTTASANQIPAALAPAIQHKSTVIKQQQPAIREILYVKPEDRITSDLMSQFEYCNAVSIRAKHIELGSPIFINADMASFRGGIPAENIAKQEILEKKCPLAIIRQFSGSDIAEYWEINEMEIKDTA